MKILQICHGKIIPEYNSAYSLRCHTLLNNNSELISIGGLVYKDKKYKNSYQFRNYLLMVFSILKGNRSMEIFISMDKYLRKKYYNYAIKKISESDIIIFEGPWQYNLFYKYLANKIVIYDAHNVEYLLRKNNVYNKYTMEIEKKILNDSDIIFSISNNDIKNFKEIYNIDDQKIFYLPYINKIKHKWNGINSNYVVFIGSMYNANINAVNFINNIALNIKNLNFIIIGNINSMHLKNKAKNLKFSGLLDEAQKNYILENALMALNPVIEGSGRSFKIMDYISHGLPLISTKEGLGGYLDYKPENYIIVSDLNDFIDNIKKIINDKDYLKNLSLKSYELFDLIINNENKYNAMGIINKYIENKIKK